MYKGLLTNTTVLYGSCSWTLKVELEHKSWKTQRQMLRIILHKRRRRVELGSSSGSSSSPTTNADADAMEDWVDWSRRVTAEVEHERAKCGIKSWESQQRLRKLRWAGHLARMPEDRWAKVLLMWQPNAQVHRRRMRGHPHKRWCDELNALGDWMSKAQDRESWRKLCELVVCDFS